MRAKTWIIGGAFAAMLALAGLGVSRAAPAPGSTVTVQTLTAKLMKTPSFIGQTSAKLVRGDQLKLEEAQKDWYRVTSSKGATGWINKSAVVDKAVALNTKPGGGSGGARDDEVALARSGFSNEV